MITNIHRENKFLHGSFEVFIKIRKGRLQKKAYQRLIHKHYPSDSTIKMKSNPFFIEKNVEILNTK